MSEVKQNVFEVVQLERIEIRTDLKRRVVFKQVKSLNKTEKSVISVNFLHKN